MKCGSFCNKWRNILANHKNLRKQIHRFNGTSHLKLDKQVYISHMAYCHNVIHWTILQINLGSWGKATKVRLFWNELLDFLHQGCFQAQYEHPFQQTRTPVHACREGTLEPTSARFHLKANSERMTQIPQLSLHTTQLWVSLMRSSISGTHSHLAGKTPQIMKILDRHCIWLLRGHPNLKPRKTSTNTQRT